ncbi:radical SAM protein [Telmatospirillum siberiense]|uniref:Radical SAM protein n=1 Tax=Telmatospirillum siberiense TaxID=382514 RepID=A0A2N3PXD2_9PROT|nr:radical SAM protein [Telmatospirillum siberiense]PKU25066.1 radical SAM protein [Telmatospirillum siberiense]
MVYDQPLYRPPSEGDNLIVQATLGCSFNQCSFCAMYKGKQFHEKPHDQLFAEIDHLARLRPDAHRVFLADGDAFGLSTAALLAIADKLAASFPDLRRISAYATPSNLLRKTPDELAALRAKRVSLVYVGIESGSAEVLRRVSKGIGVSRLAEALGKARAAGLKISATVILGLGGRRWAGDHAAATADLINLAPPHYLSTLQLILPPEVDKSFRSRWEDDFEPQDDRGILTEQRLLIAGLSPPAPVIFRSNHASNCLALAGTLPRDRGRLLAEIDGALSDLQRLRPDWMRGL